MSIKYIPIITIAAYLIAKSVLHGEAPQDLAKLSITELEDRQTAIDTRLNQLARFSYQSGVGSNGSRSIAHRDSDHTEWFEVQLREPQAIDQIILVPHLVIDSESGIVSDGFPIELQIIAGTQEHPEGELITRVRPKGGKQHIAPFIFPTSGLEASWVRIEATELSPRSWDGRYNFQLAEILIFQGNTNLALMCEVTASSQGFGYSSSRNDRYLVDGFMPYIMDAGIGEQSRAYISEELPPDLVPELTIDLGEIHQLEQIHLHRLEINDKIPLSKALDYGMPKRLRIEGATRADFSDRSLLLDLKVKNSYETGPIIMRNLNGAASRFIKLSVLEPFIDSLMPEPTFTFGLAEIELYSNQSNVAYKKIPTANFENRRSRRPWNLTDGRNYYGKILPIREWLEQLAERYKLETERPLIRAELDRRYAQQSVTLKRMGWLAMLLTISIVLIILIDRILRLRQIKLIRERFAADLHDDLGASLHTIGLLGDVALASMNSPERLQTALTRSREITKRTSAAIRHCTDLQTSDRPGNLEKDMQRTAERILVNIKYTFTTSGNEELRKLKPRLQMDLLLFLKEALTNIVKHAHANKVSIEVTTGPNLIEMKIQDDGRGLSQDEALDIPRSIERRARLMKASISIGKSSEYTTVIHLILRQPRFIFWK